MKSFTRTAAIAALSFLIPLQGFAAGAIAVDDEDNSTPGYGWVIGARSTDVAGNAAMAECQDAGGKSCRIATRFEACGAYVASWRFSAAGQGATKAEAIGNAMSHCKDCKVVVADCDNVSKPKSNMHMTSARR